MEKECILELNNLTKKFADLTAVDSVNLKIEKGEIFGLLGPNGAGKTTIIKMLCTILQPTQGTAKICGYDILTHKHEVRNSIGVVFQDPSTDEELTAYENMFFHGKLYGLTTEMIEKRTKELLGLVELLDKKDKLVKEFSGGMKRRLEIARGLMHRPKVLFLDEPTLGLDPQTRIKIWDYIADLNKKENITIILTTHYMEEADKLCRRVGIIDNGKIIADSSPDALKESLEGGTIIIGTENSEKMMAILKKDKTIKKITLDDGLLTLSTKDAEKKTPLIFKIAQKNKIVINSITIHKPTLEDVFLHYTGRKIREEQGNGFVEKARMMRMSRR